jgi:hypothetical protein
MMPTIRDADADVFLDDDSSGPEELLSSSDDSDDNADDNDEISDQLSDSSESGAGSL